MIRLYDPRTNIISESTYEHLSWLTGKDKRSLMTYRSKGKKIKSINSYILKDDTTITQRKEWYQKEKYKCESWKEIQGSDGKYLVSNYGRFKKIGKTKLYFVLPYLKRSQGHLEVKVLFNKEYKSHRVSKIVALHFLGVPQDKEEVIRHKNGIKTDNFSGNLEYIQREKLGKLTGAKKSKPVVKLDKDTAEVIGEYRSIQEARRECFLSYQSILDNCKGRRETTGGFVFMYAENYEEHFSSSSPPYSLTETSTLKQFVV